MLLALEGMAVPPESVYAPVSVLALPWPLFIQLAKRIAEYHDTRVTGYCPWPAMTTYLLPTALARFWLIPPSPLYKANGSAPVGSLALRNSAYWVLVTS